jgi:peptidoglycan hydrolase-like protein with peptidoglycan-binding domain
MHSYLDAFYNTGYFGPLTQTALAKYQKDHGIFPASGYYGSITRAAVNTTPNAAVTTSTTASTTTFNRVLTIGSIGSDVQALQQFLNAHGFTLVESGAGSSGNETTYFGSATEAALAKFQQANGITPAVGYFGPITMKAVNTLFKSQ